MGSGNFLRCPQERSLLDGVWERVTLKGGSSLGDIFGRWYECGCFWKQVQECGWLLKAGPGMRVLLFESRSPFCAKHFWHFQWSLDDGLRTRHKRCVNVDICYLPLLIHNSQLSPTSKIGQISKKIMVNTGLSVLNATLPPSDDGNRSPVYVLHLYGSNNASESAHKEELQVWSILLCWLSNETDTRE